jgi:transcriptional activator of cad operon
MLKVPATADPLLRSGLIWAAITVLCFTLLVVFFFRESIARHFRPAVAVAVPRPQKSIAVLPFPDLTEGMKDEEFADGMTEELIDKLTKIPGLSVAPPTSSFYFKGKQIAVAEVAKSLGVSYVLDGSVRKSGGRVRVAARLIRADNGNVIWSDSYDRPYGDILMVQDDIAGEVAKALRSSI